MTLANGKKDLWRSFCNSHGIGRLPVPLFDLLDGKVREVPCGRNQRMVLARSGEMEQVVIRLADEVAPNGDPTRSDLQGILYMMFWLDGDEVVPLYVGRAGKYGKAGRLSVNLANLTKDKSKFARWGSSYAYHIGDLSSVVCRGHAQDKQAPKYRRWAERLFERVDDDGVVLRRPTYFWATAWGPTSYSIWDRYSPSSLGFQEYLLIGVASDLFPDALLNTEGVN